MKTAFRGAVLAGMCSAVLYANGGAYHYGLKSSGTLEPFRAKGVEQVAILDERLEIDLGRGAADVKVRYVMKNTGDRRVKVRFGFPLELPAHSEMAFWGSDKRPGLKERLEKNLENYQVYADGKAAKSEFRQEEGTREERRKFDYRLEEIGGWMVSELSFAKGQERIVQISYRSHYDQAGSFVSDDVHHGPKVFKYRLSTGAVWNGPIRKGTVLVTARDVFADEVELFKPVGRFKRQGKSWQWKFSNLEPTLADDLEIRAEPKNNFLGRYSGKDDGLNGYFEQAGIWSMEHRMYEIEASSVLAPQADGKLTYEAGHVRRWKNENGFVAWAEGAEDDGIGEWLEVTPEEPLPLYAIGIRPGYGKSEKLYRANNRPSKVEIVLNGEHAFEARLEDRNVMQRIRVHGYTRPVKKARIVIKEVYPGTAYQDTCISYLTLYAQLKKKPEVRGAR